MASVVHPRLSTDEFVELLAVIGDHHELIEGQVVIVVPDGIAASRASSAVARALEAWVASPAGFGEVLVDCCVRFDADNQLGPDVAWFSRAPDESAGAVRSRVPELVVEVLAPSTRENDLGAKLEVYRRAGVQDYWVIDPAAGTAMAARFAAGELALAPVGTLTSSALPGFSLAVPS